MPLENRSDHTSPSAIPAAVNSEVTFLAGDSEDPNIRAPSLPADTDAHLERLFRHACELYDCAQMLKDPADRAAYQKELASICGLLAYKVPERSPMAKYLTQSRREQVADEINSAILYNARRPPISYLELYVRYTTVLMNNLNELRVKVPPASSIPAGVRLPPRRQPSPALPPAIAPAPSKGQADKDSADIIPPFDLKQFLSP
ncbi:hypothetical protein EWM64_g2449 [Hericium alpestre]|uniref:CRA domain-containing protein n=1 Tax=Hericium alpestre TaxID=135208 RepID=A0A4Z0A6N7_9AGAM|nr:hypothetical protein EWM64_g2449 [Hericium alpestre]